MAENTSIEWCNNTFNPWIGCTKVSPGCINCYAEHQDKFRSWTPEGWGKGKPRRRTSAGNWKLPLKWNQKAGAALEQYGADYAAAIYDGDPLPTRPDRPRVFCASLADWLDDEVPIEWLADLLDLIRRTPNLDWLLLTKRPQNFMTRISAACRQCDDGGWDEELTFAFIYAWMEGTAPDNVWIGTTVEDQTRADERIPLLLSIPARVRFLSCEPLLSVVDLTRLRFGRGYDCPPGGSESYDALGTIYEGGEIIGISCEPGIHWVIAGGESGPGARPMHPDWARSLRDQCQAAGVAFLFKQWGEAVPGDNLVGGEKAINGTCCLHRDGTIDTADCCSFTYEETAPEDGAVRMHRVGKKAAGRLLDGREWNEFPALVATAAL